MRQLLFLALIVVLGYLISLLLFPKQRGARGMGRQGPVATAEEMVRDPVCHLYLPRSEATRRVIRGQEHFFCGPACLDKFLAIRS